MQSHDIETRWRNLTSKSFVVGVIHLLLVAWFFNDRERPSDQNIGGLFYTLLGVFILLPYQLVLVVKLMRSEMRSPNRYVGYAGFALSLLSLWIAWGIWSEL